MSGGEDDLATAELVAFHVEGTAYYLVPLQLLDRFVVTDGPDRSSADASAHFGWGARVPEVPWNSFHDSQVGLLVDLAPGVTARLERHHFAGTPDSPAAASPGQRPPARMEHP
jgi:hypothetical protein